MQSKYPWHIETVDGNHGILGPSVIKDIDDYVVAEGLWTADAEHILACVNFCTGFSNEDLEKVSVGVQNMKNGNEVLGEVLLEIRDEYVKANQLLKLIYEDHPSMSIEVLRLLEHYLIEKDLI